MAGSNDRVGTNVPNRIFVGGLSPNTTEDELLNTFQQYGNVTATKIITDRSGLSKGYGFVTFVTAEEALHALQQAQGVVLRDRKLNVAQAYRKGSSSSANGDSPRAIVFPYSSPVIGRDNFCFQTAQVPMMPTYYMQYPQTAGYIPYIYPVNQDSYDQADDDVGKQYSKSSAPTSGSPDYEARLTHAKNYQSNSTLRLGSGNSPVMQHQPVFHYMPKSINGMTVVAYPSPLMMGTPTIVHVKESNGDQESMLSELSYLHSPMSSNALTPPPTPLAPIPCDFGASPNLENARKN